MKRFTSILWILSCIAATTVNVLLLNGCRSPGAAAVRNSETARERRLTDSTMVRDSVVIRYAPAAAAQTAPPDTVVIERWHTRWRERERLQTDTVYLTVSEVRKERYVPAVYRWSLGLCIALTVCITITIVLFIVRRRHRAGLF